MLSIVTITYNAERFLERTMQSVLAQSCKDYEYIIVDGASRDGTIDMVRRYEPLFLMSGGKLRWISEPDRGMYDAMNKGIACAQGDFVWFINAGDEIYAADTVQHIQSHINHSIDIIYGKTAVVNDEGVKVSEHHKKTPPRLLRRSFLNGSVVCHQALLVRKDIAPMYNLNYRFCSDYDWSIRAVSASRGQAYLDEYVCKFLIGGYSYERRKSFWKERFRIMRSHFGLMTTLWAHLMIALKYPFSIKY